MKNILSLAVIAFCIISAASALFADTKVDKEKGTISATGTVSENFSPDLAEIVLAVESNSLSASDAANKNKKIAEKVINKLKKYIIDIKREAIKTSSYTIQPVYEYDRGKKKNIFTGYKAIHQINLKISQIDNAGSIIDTALEEGANRVDSILFSISDDREYCNDLLAKAALRAKVDAEAVASALSAKIIRIKEATVSCGSERIKPPIRYGMMQEAVSTKVETPIEAGTIKLSASVSTIFYIDE